MSKVEVFAKELPSGNTVTLTKIGRACEGIDTLQEGETELFHIRARGPNALQSAINNAYLLSVEQGLTQVAEQLKGAIEAKRGLLLSPKRR